MKHTGIPFIWDETIPEVEKKEMYKGLKLDLLINENFGPFRGIMTSLVNHNKCDAKGIMVGLWNEIKTGDNYGKYLLDRIYTSYKTFETKATKEYKDNITEKYSEIDQHVDAVKYGNFNGIICGLVNGIDNSAKGFFIAGLFNESYDLTGLEISGIHNRAYRFLTGSQIAPVNIADTSIGFAVQTGLVNHVKGHTFIEHKKNYKPLLIQTGLVNIVENYEPETIVVQAGLYNQIGDQIISGINVRYEKEKEEVKE